MSNEQRFNPIPPVEPTEQTLANPLPPPEAGAFTPTWERFPLDRLSELLQARGSSQEHEVGEMNFLDDGSVNLGNRVFAGGAEIMSHRWGSIVANRNAGPQQLLAITRPEGETYYYCFQGGMWFRFAPMVGRRNIILHMLSEDVRNRGWPWAIAHWCREIFNGLAGVAFAVLFAVVLHLAMVWARS